MLSGLVPLGVQMGAACGQVVRLGGRALTFSVTSVPARLHVVLLSMPARLVQREERPGLLPTCSSPRCGGVEEQLIAVLHKKK